jgi:hypothetical protein
LVAENKLLSPSRNAVIKPCRQCPKIPSKCRVTISAALRIGSSNPEGNAAASVHTQRHHDSKRLRA